MPRPLRTAPTRPRAAGPAAVIALLVLCLSLLGGATASADLQSRIDDRRAAASELRAKVQAQSARIARTTEGLRAAEARLGRLQASARRRDRQLTAVRDRLVAMRARLARLEKRQAQADAALSENLRAHYQAEKPDVMSVVLDSRGFADLIDRFDFYKRVSDRNGDVLLSARTARREVAGQTAQLKTLAARFQRLAAEAEERRDEAGVLRNALLRRQAAQLETKRSRSGALERVQGQLSRLQRRQERQAAAARAAAREQAAEARSVSSSSGGGSGGGGGGGGQAPTGDVPSVVAKVRAAGNEIAKMPYTYGGGHGAGNSSGYDCSGSISYALAAAGLLDGSLTSGGFMSWGEPGEGEHITIYANAGHAYMVVDGWRFDTTALKQGGTRWTREMRSSAGFTAVHPPGL